MSEIVKDINIQSSCLSDIDFFIFSVNKDERSVNVFKLLQKNNNIIKNILVIDYFNLSITPNDFKIGNSNLSILHISNSKDIFKIIQFFSNKKELNVLLDISVLQIPDIFVLMKLIRHSISSMEISYSIPYEYAYTEKPFTSYKSFYGDLSTQNIFGFNGQENGIPPKKLYIFLGFEGILSKKILEDVSPNEHVLINNLPSYFEKYKDIVILNNYDLINNCDVLFTPVNSPFDTYNFLCKTISKDDQVCIAPLSTKTIALGICLFALNNPNIRVVYPYSSHHLQHETKGVVKTLFYAIPSSIY